MDPRIAESRLLPEEEVSRWSGRACSRELQDQAWANGAMVGGNDSELWRKDEFGAWIYRLDYGNRSSAYGWEILDAPQQSASLMRPLHWQNYVDQVAAHTQSRVTGVGLRNMRRLL